MKDQVAFGDVPSVDLRMEVKLEEDEEEFRSCCGDDEVWKDPEEMEKEELQEILDEFSVNMFFKGISIAEPGDSGSGFSGIGVVMERTGNVPLIQVQKKLDFYVEELVADYLALMDGLAEALQHNIRRVYAFTDSDMLYDQMMHEEKVEIPLLIALRQRILEHASNLETFVLKVIPIFDLERPLHLAQVAVGVVSFPANGNKSRDNCSICCEEKISPMMIAMKCSHKFCSQCMRTYVDGKIKSSQVPIRCPQLGCKYYISSTECRSFLPLTSYECLEKALAEADVLHSDRIYCPYPNCSVLLDPHECLSARASSSSQSDNSCVECPVCQRDGQQTCQCAFWDENNSEDSVSQSVQESEQWAWETFNSLPMLVDAYSDQERSQLALIQRFLAGGFSLSDHHPYQSPPHRTDSYVDAMKDLHQLPWLERFVSVISDNYYEDYIQ
ncbi:hypothetical protein GH714_010166 [Hevea brasiliensis]|uniref:RING-type domain-containing protein n=1 Tax=Hevea brasiliensis TaxID=3981 RepID=A0A6A6LR13_HEVBR|nr:hypothetical protein GH714_010166 [Hevea brasiliensis]